ncbi:hypothetical protein [uncultured Campylobacter sp.]|uniref:hypothetical protein n=1 Tax=uncultured Campylobacter sp. TaxID=218934 RepID=UPI002621C2B4|nr:hypothetical protein [uncultured Campylobacter sp.]
MDIAVLIAAPYGLNLAQTRSREISKKAAKGAGVKEQILLNLEHILRHPVRFIRPLRAQLACKIALAARNL